MLRQNSRHVLADDMPADDRENDDEGEEEEEEESEPKLKYTKLTDKILPVYSHGDSTSTFLAVGDKMVRSEELRSTSQRKSKLPRLTTTIR